MTQSSSTLQPGHDLRHSIVDLDRLPRTGVAEVIFAAKKSPQQILDIAQSLIHAGQPVLATRISPHAAQLVSQHFPSASHYPEAECLTIGHYPNRNPHRSIAIVSAGTSDLPVAEEAAITAEFLGNTVSRFYDCGVAGLSRLLSRIPDIRMASVVIAVAGMEGALPSVLSGLLASPVIAVPTSIGYGANFQGVTTLLAMLTSCSSGISVVNIDNGFGAGFQASLINNIT